MMVGMTVTDFVNHLGGNQPVAELCGVTDAAVCNWKAANMIPERWYRRMAREARRLNVDIPEDRFGVREVA